MDEQRLQAYQQLIQQLLSCPNGEEPAILQANSELLDAGFLQMVVGVAGMFSQEGKENTANWLLGLASQLSEYLNTPPEENIPEPEPTVNEADIETYLQFLLQVLQTTAESQGNPQVVYPLLAANTDKLNHTFAKVLQLWATEKLEEAELNTAKYIAIAIGNFSNRIQNFSLGNKANNIEIAITGYEIVSTVFTRNTSRESWAALQNNLGNAYCNRIRGDKAENLEYAIAAYEKALEVYTHTDFPVDWAMTQNNLGLAYNDRIRGDKAQNLENAIAAYEKALEVYTRTDFPVDWATTHNNLGNANLNRIRGDKAQNLEYAIKAYTAALEVRTRKDFSVDWATTQNNLGSAYLDRIRGDKAQNLEYAIAAFENALEVRTRKDFPVNWATTQNNLGNANLNRIRGDKAQNLEYAIKAYTAALEVRTRKDFPVNWATTQSNLGCAYLERIRGDKAQNLEYAIAAFENALEVYTRTDFPVNWAGMQNNLGNAYSDRIRGDKAENLEYTIKAYENALEVYTRTDFPVDWAGMQNNLGTAYSNRIKGDKAENLEYAIAAFTAALEVRTRHDFPVDWATTQNNLGNAYSNRIRGDKAQNLEYAIKAYTAALEVYSRTDFPQNNAETLLNLGRLYQESQQLNLAYDTFKFAIATVEDLRGEIISGEESKRKQAEEWNKLFKRMVEVCLTLGRETEAISYIERSKTRNLVEQILTRDLKITTISPAFEFASLEKIVDNNTAIIEWYIAVNKILAFVIQPGGKEIKIWQSSSADFDAIFDWADKYTNDYRQEKAAWKNQINQNLQNLAKILHIEEILEIISSECKRLILIPHLFLHLFPLHALAVKDSYLMDLFPEGVSYVPSCQLLQQLQQRKRDDFESCFAIQTPTEDLYGKDLGAVTAIKNLFSKSEILKEYKAKESAIIPNNQNLIQANNLFFFCHGYFNSNSPLDSGLQLADKVLTLANIITHLKLEKCRLVTLAACESGMIDGFNISDEYIGLPSGFLLAGSTNVVSSLWNVSAAATALLMVKFYEELENQRNIVLALQNAQRWLRDSTIAEFRKWLTQSNLDENWQDELDGYFALEEQKQGKDTKIFVSPFYWSAFCAIGKGV